MATAPLIKAPGRILATSGDVQNRLGRVLGDAEVASVDVLCGVASLSILATLGLDYTFAFTDNDEAESMLGMFAVEMVVRVLNNPTALSAHSETLGSYSYSETFANRAELGLALMPAEELMLRRLVFGSNSASIKVRSAADDYADYVWQDLWGLLDGALDRGTTIIWK